MSKVQVIDKRKNLAPQGTITPTFPQGQPRHTLTSDQVLEASSLNPALHEREKTQIQGNLPLNT